MKAICAGSQTELAKDEVLYCSCGLLCKGPTSVPVHDVARHTIPVERVAKAIEQGLEVYKKRNETRLDLRDGPRVFFTRSRR